MTMFKTKEQIEEMAEKEYPTIMWSNAMISCATRDKQDGYKKGYTQAQKDILESASTNGMDYWSWYRGVDTATFMGSLELAGKDGYEAGWQAAKLSSKAQIDTLKQRELEYQGDLRGKDRIINDRSNQIIKIDKELQEKDMEIKELKEALQTIYDNSRANYIDSQEREKFRQIVEKYKLHKY